MATRYIAVAWVDRDARVTQQAAAIRRSLTEPAEWTALTDRAGLAVYVPRTCHGTRSAISLDQDAGVILGTLFERSSSPVASLERTAVMDEHQSQAIIQTHGRSLIDSHWGSCVLFLRREDDHRISVLRSPAGTLPCYYLTTTPSRFSSATRRTFIGCVRACSRLIGIRSERKQRPVTM